ncbi:site-specific integrase [Spirosoma sp. RP8]|uniref:Site-specific integrase n=1 Tax=Spirosoma liriopis TaxID=2937440 RepID=A0ABT0HV42_9BACT|nr:site-specific integrase [Spirosoma liriopis]MCK8496061.1 site-specific integrase [Spirosoma liriopis]
MNNVMFINFYMRPSTVDSTLGAVYVQVRVNKAVIVLGAVSSVSGLNLPKSIMVELSHWDKRKQRVKPACLHATVLNKAISECEQRLEKIYAQHQGYDRKMTAKGLKAQFVQGGKGVFSFPALIEKFIAEKVALHFRDSTVETYKYKMRPLLEFLKHEGISEYPAEEFTKGVLKRYKTYLITHRNNKPNSAEKACQVVKTVLLWAAENELITINPLQYTRIRVDKTPNLECLDQEEVQMVVEANLCSRLRAVADCFIFSCYTGLAYQDLKQLGKHSLQTVEGSKCLVGERQKTGTSYCIPVTPVIAGLLEKYPDLKLRLPSNQYYNSKLKEIMVALRIDKRITTHTARKTFADWCINELGLTEEATIVAMGQKSAKELNAYRRTRPKRLLSEFPASLLQRVINPNPFVQITKAS